MSQLGWVLERVVKCYRVSDLDPGANGLAAYSCGFLVISLTFSYIVQFTLTPVHTLAYPQTRPHTTHSGLNVLEKVSCNLNIAKWFLFMLEAKLYLLSYYKYCQSISHLKDSQIVKYP